MDIFNTLVKSSKFQIKRNSHLPATEMLIIQKIIFIFFIQLVTGYKIEIERVEIECHKLYCNANMTVRKFNRTTSAISGYGHYLQDFPNKTQAIIKAYGFFSNEYRLLPVEVKRNMCSFFDFEYKMIKDQIIGNLPTKCPVKEGYFHFKDFIFNEMKFPVIPWNTNRFSIEVRFVYDVTIFNVRAYIYVHD